MLHTLPLLLLSVCCMMTTSASADDIRVPPPNPREPVDYVKWINETMSARVTDNAADLYTQVNTDIIYYYPGVLAKTEAEMERAKKADNDWTLPLRALRGPWSGKEFKPMEAWLAANSKNLNLIREGSRRSGCFFQLTAAEDPDDFVELAYAARLRNMAKLLITDGWRHVALGDRIHSCQNATAAIRLGHQAETLPFALDRLVGTACAQIGYDALIRTLEHADSPSELATQFMEELVKADREWSSLETVYQMEKPWFYHFLQSVYQWDPGQQRLRLDEPKARRLVAEIEEWAGVLAAMPDGRETGDRTDNKVTDSPPAAPLDWSRIEFDATLREGNRHFDAAIAWANQRYDSALRTAERIERAPAQSPNRLVRAMFSGLTRTRYMQERVIATQHATHTIYAIWAYHHKRGVFPSRLSAARSPAGRDMHVDPFSGNSLVYKRTRDGFTLYSVGLDQDDDGGRHHPQFGEFTDGRKHDGDYVFWPPVPLEPY